MKGIFYLILLVLLYFIVTRGITFCINGGCNTYQLKIPIEIGQIEIK